MTRRERQRRRRKHAHPARRVVPARAACCWSPASSRRSSCSRSGWYRPPTAPRNINLLQPRVPGQTSQIFASGDQPLGDMASQVLRTQLTAVAATAAAAPGDRRDRGPPLLPARRRRLRGLAARCDQRRAPRRRHPGRLDSDDAAGDQRLPPRQHQGHAQPQVQDRPGEARDRARGQAEQALDPDPVPERRSLRDRRTTRQRSGLRRPRRCSSTSHCRSWISPRSRCWPDCRRRRPNTTRSQTPVRRNGGAARS